MNCLQALMMLACSIGFSQLYVCLSVIQSSNTFLEKNIHDLWMGQDMEIPMKISKTFHFVNCTNVLFKTGLLSLSDSSVLMPRERGFNGSKVRRRLIGEKG